MVNYAAFAIRYHTELLAFHFRYRLTVYLVGLCRKASRHESGSSGNFVFSHPVSNVVALLAYALTASGWNISMAVVCNKQFQGDII